jgi:hypothetical protein
LESREATTLLAAAVEAARATGVTWREEILALDASTELVKLVRRSQELAIEEGAEEAASQ